MTDDYGTRCRICNRLIPKDAGPICEECQEWIRLEGFVLVVRCKECRWKNHSTESSKWLPCMDYVYGENFFCKYGERKDES